MLDKLQKLRAQHQSEKGFTIIEVMIVLAIAGLIIVIVLFAVPPLQRNGRNTGIRSDANQVLGYISTFNTDNQGAVPLDTASTISSGVVVVNNASGNSTKGKIQAGTTGKFTMIASPVVAPVTPTAGDLQIVIGGRCPDTIPAAATSVTPVVSARSVAVIFAIETSGAVVPQCIGS